MSFNTFSTGADSQETRAATKYSTQRSEEESEQAKDSITCSECGGDVVPDEKNGEMHCEDCGLVTEADKIDRGPDWRAVNDEDSKRHSGAPVTKLHHDEGLSTNISWQDRDANGNALSGKKRRQMNRLRTWDKRFKKSNSRERGLGYALGEIERMGSALGVPKSAREIAAVIFRRAHDDGHVIGRSLEGVASAAMYLGCRQGNVPQPLSKIVEVSRMDERAVHSAERHIRRELSLEVEPVRPRAYLPRFLSELDADDELRRISLNIEEEINGTWLVSGRNPACMAGAIIYTASLYTGRDYTQKKVAEASNTSMVTIRNRYQELTEEVPRSDVF